MCSSGLCACMRPMLVPSGSTPSTELDMQRYLEVSDHVKICVECSKQAFNNWSIS